MASGRICIAVFILALAGFALAGGQHAQAQNIFLKHGQKDGEPEKQPETPDSAPTIYVKPQASPKSSPAAGAAYKDRLYNSQLQKISKLKMETLQDWHSSGLQPQTPAEIRSYADASRAASQNVMQKRRAALMGYLERQRSKSLKTNAAAQQKSVFDLRQEQAIAAQEQQKIAALNGQTAQNPQASQPGKPPAPATAAPPQQQQQPQKPVYARPENPAKSKKVFEPYR